MLGPVFNQEMLLGGRRNKLHVFRWIYAGWLVVQVLWYALLFAASGDDRRHNFSYMPGAGPYIVGAKFSETFVMEQLLFLALVTPAFVAGAITDEKRRGTLQYLLCTDLDARHIILGKLFGRSAQVGLVLLTGLPIFALFAALGGVEPLTMLVIVVVYLAPLFAIASATVLASVLCKQTRDAVLILYAVAVFAVLLVWSVGGIFNYFNPLYVLEPVWTNSGSMETVLMLQRLVGSVVAWGSVGLICLGLAMWRMRPVYLRELEAPPPKQRMWMSVERIPVTEEPVLWRERHVEGLAPTPTLRRIPSWLTLTGIVLATTLSSVLILVASMPAGKGVGALLQAALNRDVVQLANLWPNASIGFLVQSLVALLLATLVVGVRCSGAITGEREKRTWEALLLTPLSAKSMIHGKLWGIMGASYWYLVAYGAPAVALAVFGGAMALFWTVLLLAVTFLAMYFIGAAGLYCSASSKSSWQSLLVTALYGYLGGLVLFLLASPVTFIVFLLLCIVLMIVDLFLHTGVSGLILSNFLVFFSVFLISTCVAMALACWIMARYFLSWAQRWVADRERTRHWYDEPLYRRSRRQPLEREAWSR